MTLLEVIKLGKPHKRKNDNYVYFVPHIGGIGYSQQDVLADDWEVAGINKFEIEIPENVIPIKKKRGRPKKT